ncbi:MAG: cell division protein FtsA [Massilibacteroides sp.]|nr:cell division protein FtsA [Massilibacteroides sp.]MDD3062020.1 cell division protein FtsA [Massilibacteroides sp.]MDD4115649.1 cell division protein FtsA [Massilibacteroides sp.]MDD4659263.1 cell division protein FtsA [Massilibacteroides sp.]
MQYTNFIAAIDLGTSHIIGIVGIKNSDGTLSIIAHETELSTSCIRRGCVYNVTETANKVRRLILKLENKLHGTKIGKVYVGAGGMSLRSIDHTVPKILGKDGIVSEEVIDSLYKECQQYHPDMLDVLAIVSPTYYIDGEPVNNPVGILGNRVEAHYKLIVARPSLRNHILNSIRDQAKIEIAGILVSPIALADVILSDDEKKLGCALISFGAGVTTLSIYKEGYLKILSVLPLGSHLITKDIMSLHIVEAEAERIKRAYGSAIIEKEDMPIQVNSADNVGLREISLIDLNSIVEARSREILENIYARLNECASKEELGAGIVITGGGSALKKLPEAISTKLKIDVRCSSVRKGIVSSGEIHPGNPEYAVAIGLLIQGAENCATPVVEKPEPEFVQVDTKKEEKKSPTEEISKQKQVKEKKGGTGLINRIKKGMDDMAKGLFDNEDF